MTFNLKLDVQVQGTTVAQLYRDRDDYVLKYNADTKQDAFVSLTMPVREEPWRWPRDLHPFFRQNLPEGYLLNIIREEFGPLLDGTDLSLLAVIGGMGIGRVIVTPEGGMPGSNLEALQVEQLLSSENTVGVFSELVKKYARSAISGVVPKFIAPRFSTERHNSEMANTTTANPVLGKPTIKTSLHIIKGSDEQTPFLGFNEFYTMRVLERLKAVNVAKTRMSHDGRLLIVDRFDVDANGSPIYGVEDACGLLGLPPHEKYNTTTERILKSTMAYVPKHHKYGQLEQFAWHLLTNYVVRNADCHSKNIALYYTSISNVALTPVYDIVTTQAYPRFASNPPALSILGRKTWAPGKMLERFFNTSLGIPPKKYNEMVERLCESAVAVGNEMIEAAKNEPQWHNVAKHMLHAWNDGMSSLRSPKSLAQFRGLDLAIKTAGFSDPEPPDATREIIGRSTLITPTIATEPRR